jgi:hypothetical protein
LTQNEASALLKFTEKRFIGLQKLMYVYQATFLKAVGLVLQNIILSCGGVTLDGVWVWR